MNKFKLIMGVSFMLIPIFTWSQNWQALGVGAPHTVISFKADTINNKLFVGEDIWGVSRNCLHVWDGLNWNNFDSIVGSIFSIEIFQGDLVLTNGDVLKWNGSGWLSIGQEAAAVGLYNYKDQNLYAAGWFDTIGGISASKIAKWDGVSWSAIDTTKWLGGSINCAIVFQDKLYIGGNFWDAAGTISRLARWDTTHWQSLDAGIQGSSYVQCFAEYENELYIGGMFKTSSGNPGTAIVKWDGVHLSEVGGGMSGINPRVTDMIVYNGYLYVAGGFTGTGGLPISDIARWDGINWCGLGYNGAGIGGSGALFGLEVLNNELYVAGSFIAINGDTMNYVSKWIGGSYVDTCGTLSNIDEQRENLELSIYPNPATNQITIEFDLVDVKNAVIEIKNVLGQTLRSMDVFQQGQSKLEIDISDFPQGLYVIQLINGNEVSCRKFLKQ
jgi:hypothetical protein